jgi:type IV pilus assembly protein PilE
MKKQRGFTLVELMVTVLIVGILTAIAVPGYNSYVRKARRADAKVALTNLAGQFERCYTRYNSYTNAGCSVVLPITAASGTYIVDADAAATPKAGVLDQSFAIKATPQGTQAKDTACGTFTLNNVGTKGISGTGTVANCW